MTSLTTRLTAFCALLLTLSLTSCGGGGSTGAPATSISAVPVQTATGTLVDAPVCGATYTTDMGNSGTTDAFGQFKFAPGETVTFNAAGIKLGSAKPVIANDGTAVITPVDLVAGASSANDSNVAAIGTFLNTLNRISIGTGKGSNGIFVVPTDTSLLNALKKIGTSIGDFTTAQIQNAINSAFGNGLYTVTPTADAIAGLTQGINSKGVIGTVWSGSCTCGGGGTFYFQADGSLTGFTSDGSLLSGSWSGTPTANGGVQISLASSGGGYSRNGVIAAGATTGSADIYDRNNVPQGAFSFSKITSVNALTNSLYLGGWYVNFTPNSAALSSGAKGGNAYIIAAPSGVFYGIIDGNATALQGNWNVADGSGTTSFTNANGTFDIALNFSTQKGTVVKNGVPFGDLTLARTGSLTQRQTSSSNTIPLLLNVTVSWANAPGNSVSSLALAVNVFDGNGRQIGSAVKAESTPLRTDSVRTTTTDNISVPYPAGAGTTYSASIGPSNCTIAGGSGSVVDANSGNAAAYPTLSLTCN